MSKLNTTKRRNGAIIALAAGLNITTGHCHKLLKIGMPATLPEAIRWRENRTQGDDSAAELRRQRIQLVKSQRAKIDLENAVRSSELIERAKVYESTVQVISQSRGELMRLTADLPPRLAGQPAAAIAKIMRVEIIALLTRLSGSFADAGQLPK